MSSQNSRVSPNLKVSIPSSRLNLHLDLITPTPEDSIQLQSEQITSINEQLANLNKLQQEIKQEEEIEKEKEREKIATQLQTTFQTAFREGLSAQSKAQVTDKIYSLTTQKRQISTGLRRKISSDIRKMETINRNLTESLTSARTVFDQISFNKDKDELDELRDRVKELKEIFQPSGSASSRALGSRKQTITKAFSATSAKQFDIKQKQIYHIVKTFNQSTESFKEHLRSIFKTDVHTYVEDPFKTLLTPTTESLTEINVRLRVGLYLYILNIKTTPNGRTKMHKIELVCSKDSVPYYTITLQREDDISRTVVKSKFMMVVKITGEFGKGYNNLHITQVVTNTDPNECNESDRNICDPHITINTNTGIAVHLYLDTSTYSFYLSSMFQAIEDYGIDQNKIVGLSDLLARNLKHLENLKTLEKQFEETTAVREKTVERGRKRKFEGGSTNKILKIKEQIKIIRGKYKTTKLDKYLIQIDKLKEKIEQLKLKDKKNKIKEQIKEVKALHKLNPKKAYVNKMIKLKEKLNNM